MFRPVALRLGEIVRGNHLEQDWVLIDMLGGCYLPSVSLLKNKVLMEASEKKESVSPFDVTFPLPVCGWSLPLSLKKQRTKIIIIHDARQ